MESEQSRDIPEKSDGTDRPAPHLSRRTVLKALGATVVGSVAPVLAIPAYVRTAAAAEAGDATDAWAIAAASPIFQQAIAELKVYQFQFTVDRGHFQSVAEDLPLVGLLFQHDKTPSQRTGVSLLCTVDTTTRTLRAVQYLVGWCQDGALDVMSVLLEERSIQPQFVQTRGGLVELPGPRQEHHWSFSRPTSEIPPPPDPLPREGWPVDPPGRPVWFYGGCSGVAWAGEGTARILRCAQVTESRAGQADASRVFDLKYDASV